MSKLRKRLQERNRIHLAPGFGPVKRGSIPQTRLAPTFVPCKFGRMFTLLMVGFRR